MNDALVLVLTQNSMAHGAISRLAAKCTNHLNALRTGGIHAEGSARTKVRPPDLVRRNRCIGEIRMILNVAKPPNEASPPNLGGVARRRFISRAGVVPEENHPVCAPLMRLRDIFLMGAAIPS